MSINICGVEYSVNGTIRLDLSKKNLKEIPDNVFELVNLEVLNLICNELMEIPDLSKLVNLKHLDLYHNKLMEIPDVSSLVKLEMLDLSYNELIDILIEINKLINLESLYLGYNELKEIPDISDLVKLTTLFVSHNELIEIPVNVNKLINLEYLYLDYNELTSIPSELCEMKKLMGVDLSNNCIADDDSVKIFKDLRSKYYKNMDNQKQQSIKMLILPMVII